MHWVASPMPRIERVHRASSMMVRRAVLRVQDGFGVMRCGRTRPSGWVGAMGRPVLALMLGAVMSLGWMSPGWMSASFAQQAPIDLNDPAAISAGQETFNGTCAGYCHGRDGIQGKGPSLRNRNDLSEQRIHDTIMNGRRNASKVMPSWKEYLSDEKIWQITAFIRSLREAAK